jgi:hypothetical protein
VVVNSDGYVKPLVMPTEFKDVITIAERCFVHIARFFNENHLSVKVFFRNVLYDGVFEGMHKELIKK